MQFVSVKGTQVALEHLLCDCMSQMYTYMRVGELLFCSSAHLSELDECCGYRRHNLPTAECKVGFHLQFECTVPGTELLSLSQSCISAL